MATLPHPGVNPAMFPNTGQRRRPHAFGDQVCGLGVENEIIGIDAVTGRGKLMLIRRTDGGDATNRYGVALVPPVGAAAMLAIEGAAWVTRALATGRWQQVLDRAAEADAIGSPAEDE